MPARAAMPEGRQASGDRYFQAIDGQPAATGPASGDAGEGTLPMD